MASNKKHPDIVYSKNLVSYLHNKKRIHHKLHILQSTKRDIRESNSITLERDEEVDNYYMLMKVVEPHTTEIICGDTIDEQLGGYYSHIDEKNIRRINKTTDTSPPSLFRNF